VCIPADTRVRDGDGGDGRDIASTKDYERPRSWSTIFSGPHKRIFRCLPSDFRIESPARPTHLCCTAADFAAIRLRVRETIGNIENSKLCSLARETSRTKFSHCFGPRRPTSDAPDRETQPPFLALIDHAPQWHFVAAVFNGEENVHSAVRGNWSLTETRSPLQFSSYPPPVRGRRLFTTSGKHSAGPAQPTLRGRELGAANASRAPAKEGFQQRKRHDPESVLISVAFPS
jgi:hypothetical protein